MNKVLIIYELIPEDTEIYYLGVHDIDLAWMRLCHGVYMNTSGTTKDAEAACDRLSVYLQGLGGPLSLEKGKPFDVDGPVTVIHTGIMLH